MCQENLNPDAVEANAKYKSLKRFTCFSALRAARQIIGGSLHLVLWLASPARRIIETDIDRWLRDDPRQKEQAHFSSWRGLTFLLWAYPEFRNLMYYRVTQYEHVLSRLILIPSRWIYWPLPLLYFYTPKIGEGLFIQHGFSTVMAAKSIGAHCWINQQVTIGYDDNGGSPTIGNNVRIAAGAVVFGNITIGDNVVIGANALVCKSVPPNCTVVGVPAYIVKRDGQRVREEL